MKYPDGLHCSFKLHSYLREKHNAPAKRLYSSTGCPIDCAFLMQGGKIIQEFHVEWKKKPDGESEPVLYVATNKPVS